MLYMVTFTINIPQMLAYIPYMDPMGYICIYICIYILFLLSARTCSQRVQRVCPQRGGVGLLHGPPVPKVLGIFLCWRPVPRVFVGAFVHRI